ncbi:MAG: hypothetical protein JSV92_00940 [archaeon]|nr:MAG: hypothetical protein JSV92_00940 [archaeon]
MADWKVILVVLLGLLLISVGLFTEIGLNLGGFGRQISDTLGRSIPLDFWETGEGGNISISGNFYVDCIDLRTLPLGLVKVSYLPSLQDTDIFLSDTRLTTNSQTEIELSGYSGTFSLNNTRLSLVGNAEEVTVNRVKFETVKKLIPVKMETVFFDRVYVEELYMNRLELEEVVGEVNIQNKVNLKMTGEPLKLEGFAGSLNVTSGNYEINGMVRRVFVSGNDYTAMVS